MRIILLSIIAIQLISCLKQGDPRKVEIAWEGGTDLSSISIIIDAVRIEAGPDAYANFIRYLEPIPAGAHLHFSYPNSFIEKNYEQSGGMDPLPFNGNSVAQDTFYKVCLRKRLSFSMSPK